MIAIARFVYYYDRGAAPGGESNTFSALPQVTWEALHARRSSADCCLL